MTRFLLLASLLFALSAHADERLDLNRASADELQHLPGIGPSKARAIVDERAKNGPYASVDDLDRVKGIGASIITKLRPVAFAGSRDARSQRSAVEQPGRAASDDPPIPRAPVPIPAAYDVLDRESPDGKINLNLANEDELLALAGMTMAQAKIIVAWRKVKGPFRQVGELLRIPGLPSKLVSTIVYFVATRVDASSATESQLLRLGVTSEAASAAIGLRARGGLRSKADVDRVPGIGDGDRQALRYALWFPR